MMPRSSDRFSLPPEKGSFRGFARGGGGIPFPWKVKLGSKKNTPSY